MTNTKPNTTVLAKMLPHSNDNSNADPPPVDPANVAVECPRRHPNLRCSCPFLKVPPRFSTVIWDITTLPLQWANLKDCQGQVMDNLSKIVKFAQTWADGRVYWIPLWGYLWPVFLGPWVEVCPSPPQKSLWWTSHHVIWQKSRCTSHQFILFHWSLTIIIKNSCHCNHNLFWIILNHFKSCLILTPHLNIQETLSHHK